MAAKSTAHRLLSLRRYRHSIPKSLPPFSISSPPPPSPPTLAVPARRPCSSTSDTTDVRHGILLLTEKFTVADKDEMIPLISALADRLLALPDDMYAVSDVLESHNFSAFLVKPPPGFASIELLSLLKSRPLLALKVFDWRRKQAEMGIQMMPEEYSKAIAYAGRARNVGLAADLFSEAVESGIQKTCIYNALMAAYMCNGFTDKGVAVFETLKQDPNCEPTISSYNILLSIYGRSMLIEKMEGVLHLVDELKLSYTTKTYNTVIAAYVTAWLWDKMEGTFRLMEERQVQPDTETMLLMLRGYAHSGNLEKMEKTYESKIEAVHCNMSLLRMMVCAYCKSSDPKRVHKIETLLQYIPKDEYRPWLNVHLIRVYANECLLDNMEQLLSEAFQRRTIVTTAGVMRSIISGYFNCNAVDKLDDFVKKAEHAGWRLCSSLYHCKMVMYGRQNRLEEMHGVLNEMVTHKFYWTRKTFLIMYKAYSKIGRKLEAESVIGLMWKYGLGKPGDTLNPWT